jgi:hypothetical protein
MKSLASWSGFLGVISLLLATVLGCAQFSEFDHVSQYLSEMYAVGTPYGRELRLFLLVPGGVLITVFALLAGREYKSRLIGLGFLGIAISYGCATVVGSAFPCDAGCPRDLSEASPSYVIHLTAGMVTHLLVPPSLLLIGIAAWRWTDDKAVAFSTITIGTLGLGCNVLLGDDPTSPYAGLFQRIFEGSTVGWILIVVFGLQRNASARLFDYDAGGRMVRPLLKGRSRHLA